MDKTPETLEIRVCESFIVNPVEIEEPVVFAEQIVFSPVTEHLFVSHYLSSPMLFGRPPNGATLCIGNLNHAHFA
jgi:hypothetical protein